MQGNDMSSGWKRCRIRKILKRATGFASLCLMTSACCSAPIDLPQYPSVLLEPCEDPQRVEIRTNADIVRMLSLTIQAYEACRAKHGALVMAIDKGE